MPTTRVHDLDLYFDTFGDPGHETVLLVSGLGAQCPTYDEQMVATIVAAGYHVVRYDNRDVGLSSRFADAPVNELGAAYTLADMAADGIAVLDALGVEKAHVMGLSMGGMIVQQMAIAHRDRLFTMTSVMSTTGEPEYRRSSPRAFELLTAPGATTREGYVQQWIDGLEEWGSPEFADPVRWRAEAERAYDRAYDPTGAARQYMAVGASGSRAEGLRGVTTPTLVLHGDKDTLIDQIGGRRTAELVPGARFELIEGMGHDYPPGLWRRWTDLVVGHIRAHS